VNRGGRIAVGALALLGGLVLLSDHLFPWSAIREGIRGVYPVLYVPLLLAGIALIVLGLVPPSRRTLQALAAELAGVLTPTGFDRKLPGSRGAELGIVGRTRTGARVAIIQDRPAAIRYTTRDPRIVEAWETAQTRSLIEAGSAVIRIRHAGAPALPFRHPDLLVIDEVQFGGRGEELVSPAGPVAGQIAAWLDERTRT